MRLINLLKKELTHEANTWVNEEIITEDQANQILAKYNSSLNDGKNRNSFGYYLLMSLAVLFAGLSLIVIVSANWDEIPRFIRMFGLVTLTLFANVVGLRMLQKDRHRPAVLWLFFGSISYGVSIMLIAQIYHLGEHFPDGIFWWAIGVLPLVIATQSRLLGLLALGLGSIWFGVEASENFFPASYPIFLLVGAWLVLYQKTSKLLYLAVIVGAVSWINLSLSWAYGGFVRYEYFAEQFHISIGMGVLLNGLSWRLMQNQNPVWKEYGLVTHVWLLRAALVTLFIFSFDDVWRDFRLEDYRNIFAGPVFIGVMGLVSFWLARPSGRHASFPILLVSGYFTFAFLASALIPEVDDYMAFLTNLVLVIMGISLIRRGIEQVESHYFYTGVSVLLLLAFIRYFDLIGSYLGGASLFFVAALILLGAARYWKKVQGGQTS